MSKLDEYQAFVTIVELKSLSKAAQALHLSPSAISKKLTQLEDSLSVTLLERSTRSLAVTDVGKLFYKDCKSILASVTEAEERLVDNQKRIMGKLTLSCPRVLLQPQFFHMLNQFKQQHPDIKFDVSVSNEIEDLIDGQIDFAFRIAPLKDSRLTAIPFLETRPVFCASPKYIEKHGKPKNLLDLKKHTAIIPTYLNLSDRIRQLFPNQGGTPDLELFDTTDDVYALYQWVKQGGGISMMLDVMINEDINDGVLKPLFPELPFPTQKAQLLFNKTQYQPKKMVLFRKFIRAYAGNTSNNTITSLTNEPTSP